MNPRIVHVTTVHRPFDARIFHKECVSIATAGYDTVLVQRGTEHRIVAGVRIVPMPTYGSRLARMTFGIWRAARLALQEKPDIVHFHDPELILAALLWKLSGLRVVYDVHENLHLDMMAKPWIPGPLKPTLAFFVRMMESASALLFDHIVAATDKIAERFPSHKTTIVRNAPILSDFCRPDGADSFAARPANMVYIGGLGGGGDVKGVDLMLAALAQLPPSSPIRLLLGGPEPRPGFIEALKAKPGGERIDYLGYVDPRALGEYYARAIGALILYPPQPNNVESEPVKLFEAMASGVPAICSDFPWFKQYVDDIRSGLTVSPFDSEGAARAMTHLEENRDIAETMGMNGHAFVCRERNWEAYSEVLVAVYQRLVTLPRDAPRQ